VEGLALGVRVLEHEVAQAGVEAVEARVDVDLGQGFEAAGEVGEEGGEQRVGQRARVREGLEALDEQARQPAVLLA
jgi:hypothetical protein